MCDLPSEIHFFELSPGRREQKETSTLFLCFLGFFFLILGVKIHLHKFFKTEKYVGREGKLEKNKYEKIVMIAVLRELKLVFL